MRIIITDSGRIWNPENPYLEKYREIILVVCLSGKKVTDKYECFVSSYEEKENDISSYGMEDGKFQALASVAGKLNFDLHYHDDVVFLTDNDPRTLYPYYVIRRLNEYNSLHLVTVSPWIFDTNTKRNAYNSLLSDLSYTDSVLCYNSSQALDFTAAKANIDEAENRIRDNLGLLMPRFLGEIDNFGCRDEAGPFYFDFASQNYVCLKEGFDNIDLINKQQIKDFVPMLRYATLGMVFPSLYPDQRESIQEAVAQPSPRLDGKKVCNILREQRIRLAEANCIPFKSEECPSIGPCAGTCAKCDRESAYLAEKMECIQEEQRIYPEFDPAKELE